MMKNTSMNAKQSHAKTEEEMAAFDAIDPFFQLFESGMPLGDIIWNLDGRVIDPHPDFGYDHMFSSPISQLGIPEALLKEHGLLGY
jgi:hypothetical protein